MFVIYANGKRYTTISKLGTAYVIADNLAAQGARSVSITKRNGMELYRASR